MGLAITFTHEENARAAYRQPDPNFSPAGLITSSKAVMTSYLKFRGSTSWSALVGSIGSK